MPGDAASCILTLNGGSSSVKFAAFSVADPPTRLLGGNVDSDNHAQSITQLVDQLRRSCANARIAAVGHRVVHGGLKLAEHQLITDELIEGLRGSVALDLAHLPGEIALIEASRSHFAGVPQVACFDTAFHRELPRVAKLLPIPRRHDDAGVRRLGFHGLSYAYLMDELRRVGRIGEPDGRVILAHLGAGASLAAVRNGKPVDTSMAFTPTAGLVMSTRPGDLDPGLVAFMMRSERLSADELDDLLNRRCGLAGVSGSSGDMRDLIARRGSDIRAAEAVELFCYQARKWIGAFAAALQGLDTLVFSAGIGENSPQVRAEVCNGLEFIGLRIDSSRNANNSPVISADDSHVTVRVIRTDEESVIARIVRQLLRL